MYHLEEQFSNATYFMTAVCPAKTNETLDSKFEASNCCVVKFEPQLSLFTQGNCEGGWIAAVFIQVELISCALN